MNELMNVLYVTRQGAYLRLDHDALRVEIDGGVARALPLIRLSGIVCFGNVLVSSAVICRCAEEGIELALLDGHGHFQARVQGRISGNVLLRRAQHLALSDENRRTDIMRQIVAGKIQNCRRMLLRSARDASRQDDSQRLCAAADRLAAGLGRLRKCDDRDVLLGAEGEAARVYFEAFNCMLKTSDERFMIERRSRRPPRDRTNAVLSFLYTLLRHECESALEGVGLDPQVGFLHSLRPGRPALALDLLEEFRSVVADRLTVTMINRGQLRASDFEEFPGGAVYLSDDGRRTVIEAYQRRKSVEVSHPVLKRSVPVGLIPHIQSRLLARHLRGDLKHYMPFQQR
jgi:CRISPR-associated protein Cas1